MDDQPPQTLFDKIWQRHVVYQQAAAPDVLYIDLHLIHEVTSPQAFEKLRQMKLRVRRPDRTFATMDHNVPTISQKNIKDEISRIQIKTLEKNCRDFQITLFGLDSPYQGIVHVIGAELGLTQPGMTIACGDSHTSTHGAFGTIALGIGTSQVAQVLASQCLLLNKPKTMEIRLQGRLAKGVTAKDVILKIIQTIGTGGGTGYAIEYSGEAISNMNMEERMTICNMSIEAGGRYGLVAPDETTFAYLKDKKFAPKGDDWHEAVRYWQRLATDPGAKYDKQVVINVDDLAPMVTFGTTPAMAIPVDSKIPSPDDFHDKQKRESVKKALSYMNLKAGMKPSDFPINEVFIGSCTNARLSDLKAAAQIIKGKKVKKGIKAIVVPGSRSVKRAAEKLGLDKIFIEAGFQWRWSGCSACIAMNNDKVKPGNYCVSSSNRNYQGRQGPGARTILASPLTAALAAVEGRIVDVRGYF